MPSGNTKFFNWPPFKLYAIDADTGKPLDPNVGVKTRYTYYDIKKDRSGRSSIIAHRTLVPSVIGSKVAASGKGEKEPKDVDAKKCDCAKKADDEKKPEGKSAENGKKSTEAKDNNNKTGANEKQDHVKPEEKPWTPKEDAKLKELKAENKSWRDIAQEMGRPQFQLKARFKGIKDLPATPENKEEAKKADKRSDATKEKPQSKDKTPKENKKQESKKHEKDANAGSTKKHSSKKEEDEKEKKEKKPKPPPKPTPTKAAIPTKPAPIYKSPSILSGRTARVTMGEWLTLQEDDMFSFGELQFLSELIARDRNQTWLRIASTFFDKTGRKVHPYDIRDKFHEMDRMG